jgi:hypothetical protein
MSQIETTDRSPYRKIGWNAAKPCSMSAARNASAKTGRQTKTNPNPGDVMSR